MASGSAPKDAHRRGFLPRPLPRVALEKKGSTKYTAHYVFYPFSKVIDIPDVGKVTALEMVGATENAKGKAAFDKMKAQSNAGDVPAACLSKSSAKRSMTVQFPFRRLRSRTIDAEQG